MIHRKRLPTLYCGHGRHGSRGGARTETGIHREGSTVAGERERGSDGNAKGWLVSPDSQVAAFNLFQG